MHILDQFWAKILISMGVSKRFGTNITENCFRKKIRLTRQKVFPPPTVGGGLPVKALALLARGPFGLTSKNKNTNTNTKKNRNTKSNPAARDFGRSARRLG